MNRKRAYVLIPVVLAALGFLVVRGLGNATEYFRTADEAVAQQAKLGTKRFRLEGVVVENSVCSRTNGVEFVVQQNGQDVEVHHRGDPPELFRANVPVVVSGRFDASLTKATASESAAPVFASDLVMIKHSEEYVAKNKDRVADFVGKEAPNRPEIPVCA